MRAPIHVLELRSVWGTGGGPEKTILLGAARADRLRAHVTVCYIRDARDEVFSLRDRARGAGVEYVELIERHSLDPRIWPALRQLVIDRRVDVVHSHDYKTDLLAWMLARRGYTKAVATAHGWSGVSVKERCYYAADRRLLARFPLVVTVSEAIRTRLLASGARPAAVRRLLNGIDAQAFRRNAEVRARARHALGLAPNTVAIGTVGRLERVKRHDVLVDAFAQLPHRDARLLIAGDGPERQRILSRAAALGVGGRVTLAGHVDDAAAFHQALDVYVQSSDSEGIPNAVLEAMALETPVVATDVGGTAELLRADVDGLLVPRRDACAIARRIDQVLRDPAGASARARAARRRVERDLSFDARVTRLHEVYEEIVYG